MAASSAQAVRSRTTSRASVGPVLEGQVDVGAKRPAVDLEGTVGAEPHLGLSGALLLDAQPGHRVEAGCPYAVRAGHERDLDEPALPGIEELLGHDVRRQLRAADAVVGLLHLADRRARAEHELDGLLEARGEIDPARAAVHVAANAGEGVAR